MTKAILFTQEAIESLPDYLVGIREASQIARCSTVKQFRLLTEAGIIPLDLSVRKWAPMEVLLAADKALIKPDNIGHTEVYFIETGPFVKIGYSVSAINRLFSLQGATPYELNLIGTIKGSARDEDRLHTQFAHLRQRGEWFKKSETLMSYIAWLLEHK